MKYDKSKVKASLMRLASEIIAIIDIIDGTAGEDEQNRQDTPMREPGAPKADTLTLEDYLKAFRV
jgi:hypothetical protein